MEAEGALTSPALTLDLLKDKDQQMTETRHFH